MLLRSNLLPDRRRESASTTSGCYFKYGIINNNNNGTTKIYKHIYLLRIELFHELTRDQSTPGIEGDLHVTNLLVDIVHELTQHG